MLTKFFIFSALIIHSCGSGKNKPQRLSLDQWTVTSINENSSFSANPTISLSVNDKTISGNTGCNNFNGRFTLRGNKISFGQMASTKMFCKNMDTEDRFFSTLEKVSTYSIENDELVFFDKANKVVMKLKQTNDQKEITSVKYQAFSRGFFQEVLISEKNIIFHDDRDYKNAKTQKISKKEWEEFMRLLSVIDVEALPKLKAPTAKRLYDGAPHATLTIEKKGQTTSSSSFDHGHPPKQLKALVDYILSFKK